MPKASRKQPLYTPIGLDHADGVLKAIQFARRGDGFALQAMAIERIGETAEPEQGTAQLADGIRALLAQGGFKGSDVSLSIPSDEVDVREVRLAESNSPENRERFQECLRGEARACLLYNPEEAVIDALPLDAFAEPAPKAGSAYLLVAVRKKRAEYILNAVRMAGLKPLALDIRPCALVRTLEKSSTPIAAIELEKYHSSVSISIAGRLQFNRVFKVGWMHIAETLAAAFEVSVSDALHTLDSFGFCAATDANFNIAQVEACGKLDRSTISNRLGEICGPTLERFALEIQRTLKYFSAQRRAQTEPRLLLFGDHLFPGIEAILSSIAELSAERAHSLPPLARSCAELNGKSASFAVAVGLALREAT